MALASDGHAWYVVWDGTVADPARPGHVIRTPFAGNIVPQNRIINPMYKFLNSYLPLPNVTPADGIEPNRNFDAGSALYYEHYTQLVNRYDYNISSNNRVFFRWSWNDWQNHGGNFQDYLLPDFRRGSGNNRHNSGLGMDWVHNFGARMLLDVSVGSNRYMDANPSPGTAGYLPSSFGLPTYMDVKTAQSAVAQGMASCRKILLLIQTWYDHNHHRSTVWKCIPILHF